MQRLKTPGSHLWIFLRSYRKSTDSIIVSQTEKLLDREIEKTVDELLEIGNKEKKKETETKTHSERSEEKDLRQRKNPRSRKLVH